MPVKSRSARRPAGRPEGSTTDSSPWDVAKILGFLHRQGEAKPRLSDWGNQFQVTWKVQLFGPTLGWSRFIARGHTIEQTVSNALAREYNESRTFLTDVEDNKTKE